MSAVGNVGPATDHPAAEPEEDEEGPGLWGSFGVALRLIVGWFSIAIAVLNLLVELDRSDGTPDGAYVFFHFIVLVGGVLLVSLAWIGARPGILGYVVGAAVMVAGVVVSAIPANDTVCCMTAFSERHGYPFTILARDAGSRWHVDSQHLIADLLFWGYLGLVVLLTVALTRRVAGLEDDES
ncbi:hypothetical protein [Winogradskya humida]|uniref:Membrane protein YphA (DoxX/SURF4 family) n=1 Tax=Winogradskya humida TaxID=113566 RepID=A0ABQ3ZRN3_9ACTN|nr:hypothetical protein [Actinoplanes humidus]GIE21235.1 hypothetical protein Ahu01nite_043370 [Actinoplanes humidus]